MHTQDSTKEKQFWEWEEQYGTEEAIEVARANKATSYEYIRDSEHKLRNIRQAGDSNQNICFERQCFSAEREPIISQRDEYPRRQ